MVRTAPANGIRQAERLHVPTAWWLATAFWVGTFWLACWVPLPGWWGHLPGLVVALVAAVGLVRIGALRIVVDADGLTAGRAHLPASAIGSVQVLSRTHARVVRGAGADASAHFCLRPYVRTAIRVEVADPADPTPYWYVASRQPERLATALERLTTHQHAQSEGPHHQDSPDHA